MGIFGTDKRKQVKKIRDKQRKEQLKINREEKVEKREKRKSELHDEKMARKIRKVQWKIALAQNKAKLRATKQR